MSGERPALIQSQDHHLPAVQSQSPHGVTKLKIVTVTSDQVWQPATMPTAEGELLLDQPSVTPVSPSSPERAPVPTSCPEKVSNSPIGPGRASVSTPSTERAPVPEFSPEKAPVPRPAQKETRFLSLAPVSEFRENLCPQVQAEEGVSSQWQPWEGVCSQSAVLRALRLTNAQFLPGPLSLQLHRGLPEPYLRLPEPPVPPQPTGSSSFTLTHQLSVSASGSSTTCSAALIRPPGVVSPSPTMAPPPVGSTFGSPLWLCPGSHLATHVPSPSCLFPGSSLHHHPGFCVPAPSRLSDLRPTLR